MSTLASSIGLALIASLTFSASTPIRSDHTQETPSQAIQVITLTDAQGEPTAVGESALVPVEVGVGQGTKTLTRSGLWKTQDGFDPGEGAQLLTEPLAVDSYMVMGLTWRGKLNEAPDSSIRIRVRENSIWSQWYQLDADESGGRDGESVIAGTDPFVTAGADGIQVLISGSGQLPADLSIELVPSHPEGRHLLSADQVETTTANPTGLDHASISAPDEFDMPSLYSTTTGAVAKGSAVHGTLKHLFATATTVNDLPVPVVARKEWGADASSGEWTPEYRHAPFVVVHHTAGTNHYTCAQSADIVRGIYSYHALSLGWGDIGYNILVDKCGNAFEGRYGTLASPAGSMVVAGHSYGFNSGTMGIALLGEYTSTIPSTASLATVGKLAGWQLKRAGVSPVSTGVYISGGNSKYPPGTRVSLPRISGHRDNGYTACPGDAVYSRMDTIRSFAHDTNTAAGSAGVSSPESPKQLTGQGAWIPESQRWRWLNSDGSYAADMWASINGVTYYFDADSLMHEGWLFFGSQWYYLTPSSGALAHGLLSLSDGAYDLGPSGAMRTGWVHYSNGWKYYDTSGRQVTGWRIISTFWYYLEPSTGMMKTGWFSSRGSTYYLDPDTGAMATGWNTINGKRYYFDPTSGALLKVGFITLLESTYYLDPVSGAAREGWSKIEDSWYYFAPSTGAMHTGWLHHNNTWYYLTPTTGAMVTGAQIINGIRYFFASSGALH